MRFGAGSAQAKATLLGLGVLVLVAVLFHWEVFFAGKTVSAADFALVARDYQRLSPDVIPKPANRLLTDPVFAMHPWAVMMSEGTLTFPWLWNPYAGWGSPFLANAQSAVFFPLKLVALVTGVERSFGFICFLKMLLAGLFTWLYLGHIGVGRIARLLASVSFMSCGFIIAWLQYPLSSAALFFPVILLGCEYLLDGRWQRGILVIASAFGLGLLAGHPETSVHHVLIGAIYLVAGHATRHGPLGWLKDTTVRRRLALAVCCFAGAVSLGSAIGAVQVVPTAEYATNSATFERRHAEGTSETPWWPLVSPGWHFARQELRAYIAPNTNGNPARGRAWKGTWSNYNESAGYVGIAVLWMSLVSWPLVRKNRRMAVFILLQCLCVGFALRLTLLMNTLGALPVLNATANRRLVVMFCFSSAVLAAMLLDHVIRGGKVSKAHRVWAVALLVLFMTALIGDYLARFASDESASIREYGVRQLALQMAFLLPAAVFLFFARLTIHLRPFLCAGVVGLLVVDMQAAHAMYNPFLDPELLYPDTPALDFLRTKAGHERVLPVGFQSVTGVPATKGIHDIRIFDALVPTRIEQLLQRFGGSSWNIIAKPNYRLASAASVRWFWAHRRWDPDRPSFKLRYRDKYTRIYEDLDAAPRAFLAGQWRTVSSADEAIDRLQAEDFDWRREAVVEVAPDLPMPAPDGSGPEESVPLGITSYAQNRVEVELAGEGAGLLVLNDTYFPGWVARVDGVRRPIYCVNGAFRGVFVRAGDRSVVFSYLPRSFLIGSALSIVGLLAFAAMAVSGWLSRRRFGTAGSRPT